MAYPFVQIPEALGVEETPEKTRKYIAWIAIGGLFVTLLVIIIGGWLISGKTIDDTLKVLTTAMGILTGMVGAIIGYYFRSES
jgi:TRAP-type C4-dicarboxylate transport system permease small subunit